MKVLGRLIDNEYPNKGYDHVRQIVRCFVYNDNKEIALIYLLDDDIFGHRDLYETPGGGVKKGERLLTALKREIKEEIGADIDSIIPLGRIIDFYNIINRENDNHYYLAHLKNIDNKEIHREPYEISIFKGVEWIKYDKVIETYQKKMHEPLGRLVANREIIAFQEALKYFTNGSI